MNTQHVRYKISNWRYAVNLEWYQSQSHPRDAPQQPMCGANCL